MYGYHDNIDLAVKKLRSVPCNGGFRRKGGRKNLIKPQGKSYSLDQESSLCKLLSRWHGIEGPIKDNVHVEVGQTHVVKR